MDDGRKLFTFHGNIGFILEAFDEFFILGVDDKLVAIKSRKMWLSKQRFLVTSSGILLGKEMRYMFRNTGFLQRVFMFPKIVETGDF